MGEAGGQIELQVSGCNLVIQSGKATEEQLAVVYGKRCDAYITRNYAPNHLEYCDEAIDREPKNAWHWYSRGRALWEKQDYDRAIGNFDEAIRLYPNFALAYADRCYVSALLAGRELRSALKDCDEALRLWANYSVAHTTRGFIYLKLSNFDSAVADFDTALQLQPDSASALYGRGLARLRKGEERDGDTDLAAAKDISPSLVQNIEHLGFTK
jgi:tetratricopeptide (TPR) repeat protein